MRSRFDFSNTKCFFTNQFRIKITDAAKLQDEYAKLVEGLQEPGGEDSDAFMGNPREDHPTVSNSHNSFRYSPTRRPS